MIVWREGYQLTRNFNLDMIDTNYENVVFIGESCPPYSVWLIITMSRDSYELFFKLHVLLKNEKRRRHLSYHHNMNMLCCCKKSNARFFSNRFTENYILNLYLIVKLFDLLHVGIFLSFLEVFYQNLVGVALTGLACLISCLHLVVLIFYPTTCTTKT